MEIRKAKIIINSAGGNSSDNSKNYKISLPTAWINALGIDENNRDVEISFDGNRIIIDKIISVDEFVSKSKKLGHKVLKISYYDKNLLCTEVYFDTDESKIKAENYTKNILKTAFGNIENPTVKDLCIFLESRCIPKERAGIKEYLNTIGVMNYEPIEIIKRTAGRMAEDEQWLKVEEV